MAFVFRDGGCVNATTSSRRVSPDLLLRLRVVLQKILHSKNFYALLLLLLLLVILSPQKGHSLRRRYKYLSISLLYVQLCVVAAFVRLLVALRGDGFNKELFVLLVIHRTRRFREQTLPRRRFRKRNDIPT